MEKHKFKKNFGQNFLNNEIILDKIINLFDVQLDSKIIEVGPGAGALTKKLLTKNVPVTCFEIDKSLKKYLDKLHSSNLNIIYNDFLNIDLRNYFNVNDSLFFVANIPYYITTPIITKFIDDGIIPEVMILMVQKEVGERLSAKPKSRQYGAITAILNFYFDISYEFTVGKENFYPEPKVDSCIIKLVKKKNISDINFVEYKEFVYYAFKQKRKNLKNNLKEYNLQKIEKVLDKYGLNLSNRAEDISYEIFIEILKILRGDKDE